jgi:diadenylate cyclase
MAPEKEKTILDYIKRVAPGNSINSVIEDLLGSDLGALIVLDSPELHSKRCFEGGFRINCRFTPQKLFELTKMDGAIIISSDMKRILYANVLITPDHTLLSSETGTRHKAAERVAKQANTFVIAVSERRKRTTLYLGREKYNLKSPGELLRDIAANLQVLEKQRDLFDESLINLNVLEVSDLVSAGDVCKIIQRSEMILKISASLKKQFIEIGRYGNIMNLRYRELIKSVEKRESEVIRDYAILSLKRTKTILENYSFEGLIDLDSIARIILEKSIEENVSSKGFRLLSMVDLIEKESSSLVKHFGGLKGVLDAGENDLEKILKNKTGDFKQELNNLTEKILEGKAIN